MKKLKELEKIIQVINISNSSYQEILFLTDKGRVIEKQYTGNGVCYKDITPDIKEIN